MEIKKYIPNFFTLSNLFSGCVAIYFIFLGDFNNVFFWVCLGIFFDFFDGFFARLFKKAGPLGVQLDSLADMVTSGVVPGLVMFNLMKNVAPYSLLPFFGFIIILAAAYRLAKFNISTNQSEHFIGLPTPANALFICFLPIAFDKLEMQSAGLYESINTWIFLLIITLLSSYLMTSNLILMSLKVKHFKLSSIKFQLILILLSILFVVLLPYYSVILIIITYIMLSIIKNILSKNG